MSMTQNFNDLYVIEGAPVWVALHEKKSDETSDPRIRE